MKDKLEKRMDYEKAHQYLTDVKRIFDEEGITFFLIFGTLLGAIRENDFIAHDSHVDIGIFGKDIDRVGALRPKFEGLGYKFEVGGRLQSSNKFMSYKIHKNEGTMKVDMYPLFLFREVRWFVRRMKGPKKEFCEYGVPFHPRFFVKLKTITFRGQEFLTPHPAKELLYYLWQEGWKTPSRGQVGNQPLGVWFHPGELKDEENPNV